MELPRANEWSVETRQSEMKGAGWWSGGGRVMSNDMNNRAAHMRPTLLTPISSPVSAGSARNETVSQDQIDAHSVSHRRGGERVQPRVV